ncbi:MAG TPA: aspartyl protease family protein [Verrucomicrobiae bacterium]|nr:aspartyl protease family protein [Verrucomicrobiae bacterium]
MKILLVILSLAFAVRCPAQGDEIWIYGKINGHDVNLMFDTGCTAPFVIFSSTAKRLGLKVTPFSAADKAGFASGAVGIVPSCRLTLSGTNFDAPVMVARDLRDSHEAVDGAIGWPVITQVLFLNGETGVMRQLTNVPPDLLDWPRFPIDTNFGDLVFDVPEQKIRVAVDTGSALGIELSPKQWSHWRSQHRRQPTTFESEETIYGNSVLEESWADEFALGDMNISSVPVIESPLGNRTEMILGQAALKRLYLIVDRRNGWIYLQPVKAPPRPYQHNRLGAVFLPKDSRSDELIARVAPGSPAFEAGVRNGDVLMKLDGADEAGWRRSTNSVSINSLEEKPAGTRLALELKRGDKIFTTTAVLRNIIPPNPTPKGVGS